VEGKLLLHPLFARPVTDPQSAASSSPAYKARFKGEVPDAMAALGYDSAWCWPTPSSAPAPPEPPKMRDALAATKGFRRCHRAHTIDAQRNASKAAVIITVKNGQFEYVEKVNP
jgi:branched-chain amino acid transport system substrate-binding protein